MKPSVSTRQIRRLLSSHPHLAPRRLLHATPSHLAETLGTAAKLPDAEAVPPLQPSQHVTIMDIRERRARAGRLIAPTAAYSDTNMFKASSVGKPLAKRWDHLLTQESLSRQPCVLKQAAKHLKQPGLISLGGGIPHPENFPFESLSMRVPKPPRFSEADTQASGETARVGKYDVRESDTAEYDLSIALNYGQANGSAQLNRWVAEHTELVCDPPYADWASCLTVGSTGALEQALRMFCDRARGDAVLTEEYSFSTALETAAPLGVRVVGVRMDEQGLLPESMDKILSGWDPRERGGARKPHLLYTVPSGQNPTGATQGERRRREIYAVARRHDVFILEDEPYYFLQMSPYRSGQSSSGSSSSSPAPSMIADATSPPSTVEEFLRSLIPSLLTMDVDGRVMRLDSFSKVAVPGARLGWVTASAQVIERYVRHAEVCSQGPSGFSQVLLHKLLDERWGHEGYLRWLMHLRGEYTRRRDAILAACERFLPQDVVSWNAPAAGMFHWLKVDPSQHPSSESRGGNMSVLDIEADIFDTCIAQGVLVGRGSWFRAEQHNHDSPQSAPEPTEMFFRTTFAAATDENMAEAIRRFGVAVRKCYRID